LTSPLLTLASPDYGSFLGPSNLIPVDVPSPAWSGLDRVSPSRPFSPPSAGVGSPSKVLFMLVDPLLRIFLLRTVFSPFGVLGSLQLFLLSKAHV